MRLRDGGIWEIFIPGLAEGANYKYSVPLAHRRRTTESRPLRLLRRGSAQNRLGDPEPSNYTWSDAAWMQARPSHQWFREPVSIYEVHLESWMRPPTTTV